MYEVHIQHVIRIPGFFDFNRKYRNHHVSIQCLEMYLSYIQRFMISTNSRTLRKQMKFI